MNQPSKTKMETIRTTFLLVFALSLRIWSAPIEISGLQCEHQTNPLGIDSPNPRFSWLLKSDRRREMQTAYQVLVADDSVVLAHNQGNQWDSGKITSQQSSGIIYQGKPLTSGGRYYWKVRVWDKDKRVSAWSDPAVFEMGLLHSDDWAARWIGPPHPISAPLLRREFDISRKIRCARIYMSGLGWSELYINGKKVSQRVLDPAMSNFDNTHDIEMRARVPYVIYDVTRYLKNGRNVLGVILGNGWYAFDPDSAETRWGKWRIKYGNTPILLLQLNIMTEGGHTFSVVSDTSWKVSPGPIIFNDLFFGETYDARREKIGWDCPGYDDSSWESAILAEPPNGKLVAMKIPPAQVMESINPIKIINPAVGKYIFDFGQHFSGWTRLRVHGSRGTKVKIRFAGRLTEDSRLKPVWPESLSATDSYILKGMGEEVWEPRFTLHGFRFAEVTGFPCIPTLASLTGRFVYNGVGTCGYFECSDTLLNQIHRNVCYTFKSSLQGIPQDAADRIERVAWLGDPGFVIDSYLYDFNMLLFWEKWLNDIRDCQHPDGDIPVVCPLSWKRDAWEPWPCWKSTYPIIVWKLYVYYGDLQVLIKHYDALVRLVDYLHGLAQDNILNCGLGDHLEPDRKSGKSNFHPRHTPPRLTSTAYYYYDTWILAQIAKTLGKTADYQCYSQRAEKIKQAFNTEFFNPEANQYATGSQTANAVALQFGLVPENHRAAVLKNLVNNIVIKNGGHLATGIIGTSALTQVLGEYGRADVMYQIARQRSYPSWGYSITKGATTIWETFEMNNLSQNMKMFGSIEKFFYKDLVGIRPAEPGYRRIDIAPQVVGDLRYVKGAVETVNGRVAVHWRRFANSLGIKVTIPVNSRARIWVPKMGLTQVAITESGRMIWNHGRFKSGCLGITSATGTKQAVVFDVGSGCYVFKVTARR